MKFYKYLLIFFYNIYLYPYENNHFLIELKNVLENHPKIKSQKFQLTSKLENYNYLKSTYPDPEFGIMWKDAPYNKKFKFEMDKYEMSGIEYSLVQPIPTPGKLTQMSKIEKKELELERLNLLFTYNQFTKEIMSLLINNYYDNEILKINKDFQKKLDLLKESSRIRYTTGSGNFSDYSKSILLEKKLETETINFENLIQIYEKKWEYYSTSVLKNQELFDSLKKYINFLYDKNNKSIEEEIKNSIYWNIAKILPEIEKEKVHLQNYEYYPDFKIFISYLQRKKLKTPILLEEEQMSSLNLPSGEDLMSFGIMFRIPLWSSFSNSKKVNSYQYSYQKEKENLQEIYSSLNFRIEELKNSIRTLERKIEITKKHLVPYAKLSYESSLQNYTVGKIDFDSLLMSWSELFEIQKEQFMQEKEYYNRIIEYLELTNQILPEIFYPKEIHYEINKN